MYPSVGTSNYPVGNGVRIGVGERMMGKGETDCLTLEIVLDGSKRFAASTIARSTSFITLLCNLQSIKSDSILTVATVLGYTLKKGPSF